jgi:membrane-bound metal-dependent hydrolase YbcI (DUF457 family)
MDPATHLLASYTLARAARSRIISRQMAVFLLAGLAPDMDGLWHLPTPLSPMRAYGTATHSLLGAGALAAAIAAVVWAAGRKRAATPPHLPRLLAAGFIAVALHLLLDASATAGIEPWWPLRPTRLAWNVAPAFDAVLVVSLTVFALLPLLLSMVKEEIGAHIDPRPQRGWPLVALVLLGAWLGLRAVLQHRAETLLGAAQYNGLAPLHWGAFPSGSSPFTWRGVVETESFLAEVEVPVGTGRMFAPENLAPRYKPEPSAIVDAIAASPLARAYTGLARFPILSIESTAEGTRAQLREMGDSLLRSRNGAWTALIELDAQSRVTRQDVFYLAARPY